MTIKNKLLIIGTIVIAVVAFTVGRQLWVEFTHEESSSNENTLPPDQSNEYNQSDGEYDQFNQSSEFQSNETADKFIVENPVNLSQIWKISKFRSCAGHDYSGLNTQGEYETNRSMKHYFAIKQSLRGTQEVKLYAPFDAVVWELHYQAEPFDDYEVYLRGPSAGEWVFIFQHFIPKSGLENGSVLRAGEEVGYAHVPANSQSFDIALKKLVLPDEYKEAELLLLEKVVNEGKTIQQAEEEVMETLNLTEEPPESSAEIYDSIFYHMSDSVLAEYEQHGVNLDNVIVSKEYRDQHPCDFNIYYDRPEDWVELE